MIYEITNISEINWAAKGHERILQNVINLMNTEIYELPYARTVGIDKTNIDKPANIAAEAIANNIIELIERREPRARVISVKDIRFDSDGRINIKAVIEIE